MTACVDASLVVKMLSREPGSDEALAWFVAHVDADIIAPPFMPAEVASAVRRKVLRKEITSEQGADLLKSLGSMGIRLVGDWDIVGRALALATELGQSGVYEAVYLALAESERCELWTADAEFAKAACTKYPCVRLVSAGSGRHAL